LVAVEGTAACRFVLHAARRFTLPVLHVRFGVTQLATPVGESTDDPVELWVQADSPAELQTAELQTAELQTAESQAAESQAAELQAAESQTADTEWAAVPLRDRLLWLLGQEIRVLATRRGGSVERLIARQQRESPGWLPVSLDVAAVTGVPPHAPVDGAPVDGAMVDGAMVDGDAADGGMADRVTVDRVTVDRVACDRVPDDSAACDRVTVDRVACDRVPDDSAACDRVAGGSVSLPALSPASTVGERLPWPALWHATRRHEGPWAGQTEAEFLDELLFERPERDRSALATLRRIVTERRLRASPWALRGGVPSVCFSAAPLHERPAMRTYRAHRGRWDAEPFGIAIRAELLALRGARPVIYGDESVWKTLAESDRPWFQRQATRAGKTPIDWTGEQEWRLLGDLPLEGLSPDDVRVFVPDAATAERIAAECPWPVLALDAFHPPSESSPSKSSPSGNSPSGNSPSGKRLIGRPRRRGTGGA
jgi:hypothetical protein